MIGRIEVLVAQVPGHCFFPVVFFGNLDELMYNICCFDILPTHIH